MANKPDTRPKSSIPRTYNADEFQAALLGNSPAVNSDHSIRIPGGICSSEIHIDNMNFKKKISIVGCKFNIISFRNCTFIGGLDFISCNTKNRLIFSECTFHSDFVIQEGSIHFTDLDKCVFNGPVILENTIFKDNFRVYKCHFNNAIDIYSGTFENSLIWELSFAFKSFRICSGDFKNSIYMIPNYIHSLIIGGKFSDAENASNINGTIIIKSPKIDDSSGKYDYNIERLSIETNKLNKLIVNDCKLGCISFFDSLTDGELFFDFIKIRGIEFNDFHNYKHIRFSNVTTFKDSYLWIKGSDLGKLQLSNFNFNLFNSIYFSASNIIDMRTQNVRFPKFISPIINEILINNNGKTLSPSEYNIEYHNMQSEFIFKNKSRGQLREAATEKRDMYRQFKKLASSQGDKIQENEFAHKEMNAYLDSIRFKDAPHIYSVLWLSKITNNMGASWLRPIICLFVFSAILYSVLLAVIQPCNFWGNIGTYWSGYWDFLNPTHKIDFLTTITKSICGDVGPPSFLFGLIDFLGRIGIAFLIVQTVTAFRRYIKAGGGDS